ncbi:MAG TPA: rhodanese-like domain-containing protein [Flavipsychrobacter sp.]
MKGMISKTIMLAAVLSLGFQACSSSPKGNELNPNAFKAAMNDKKDEILLDVRTAGEYNDGHIKGAKNIDWYSPSFQDEVAKLDKTKPVFVYCKSGGRSGQATQVLKSMGFKEVYDLEGGITRWKSEGMPLHNEADSKLQGLNLEGYQKLLDSDKLVLVDFYTTWCTPCKKMDPFLKEIAAEKADILDLQKINTDKNPAIAQHLNISGIPTMLLYKNKKMIWSYMGYIGKSELLEKISTFN